MQKRKETLSVLGAVPQLINVLLELGEESSGFTNFQVLGNLPGQFELEYYRPLPGWTVQFREKGTYEQDLSGTMSCCFGVVGIYSKPIVFEYFQALGFKQDNYVNLIHPTSYLSRSAKCDGGLQMEANSTVAAMTQIGFGVTIKRQVNIGHHVRIGNYVTVNPGATICGQVTLGDQSMVGSIVTKDIPGGVIAYGNPCKVIRENIRR